MVWPLVNICFFRSKKYSPDNKTPQSITMQHNIEFHTEYFGGVPCHWTVYRHIENPLAYKADVPIFAATNTQNDTQKRTKKQSSRPTSPKPEFRNIFTATYFKMYRPPTDTSIQALENIKNYLVGLDQLILDCKKFYPSNRFRIYCDHNSIDDLLAKYGTDPYVELYKYYMPDFIDPETRFHFGYLGTLLRFLPFFDLPLHTADTVVCLDIDDTMNFQLRRMINDCIRLRAGTTKLNFAFRSAYCYSLMPRVSSSAKYSLIASFIFMNKRVGPGFTLPTATLLDPFFRDCLLRNTCPDYRAWLDTHPNSDIHKHHDHFQQFPYGVDEYFMNNRVLDYFRANQLPYSPIFTGLDIRRFIKLLSIILPADHLAKHQAEFSDFITIFRKYLEPLQDKTSKAKHTTWHIDKPDPLANISDQLDYIHHLASYEVINRAPAKFAKDLLALLPNLNLPDRLAACLTENLDYNFGGEYHFIIKKVTAGDSKRPAEIIHKTAKGWTPAPN